MVSMLLEWKKVNKIKIVIVIVVSILLFGCVSNKEMSVRFHDSYCALSKNIVR